MVSAALRLPRRPILIVSPRRVALVGSPTRHRSGIRSCSAIQSSTRTVPSRAGPSSSPVISRLIVPRSGRGGGGDGRGKGGDGALHVAGAAAVEGAGVDLGCEGGVLPAGTGGNDVGVAGKAEMRRAVAAVGEQVGRGAEGKVVDCEAQIVERGGEDGLGAVIRGRDGGAADQGLGERGGVQRHARWLVSQGWDGQCRVVGRRGWRSACGKAGV